jgi:PAS domain S-box-containing protein
MEKSDLPNFDYVEDDDDSPGLIDRGLYQTESIDLKGLIDELDIASGRPEPEDIQATSFGKLLEALPIPTLLIDRARHTMFANQSCQKISPGYRKLLGKPFAELFPDVAYAAKVQSLVDKVLFTRKTQVVEGVLMVGGRKIWGRAHLRALKAGRDSSILVLIEDLTLEKSQLRLQQKVRKELEIRVEERTAELRTANDRLQKEIAERKRAEEELRVHRQHLEDLVADRTTELMNSIKRLKQEVRDRKKAEESLRASERRFNVAFRANPGMLSISTLKEGRYLEVNDGFCETTGYSRDEVLGRTEEELKTWARQGHREQMIQSLQEQGALRDYEAVFRRKEGKMFVGSLSAEIIDLEGEPHLLTISVDITDRKRAERDRKRMTTALEQAAEGILVTEADGTVRYANPAVSAASGYPSEKIVGTNISILRSPMNNRGIVEEIKGKLNEGLAWKGRLINRRKDGTLYEVETTVSPVRGQSGRILSFVFVERDVTNEVRLEKQLRQAVKMEAIGTLAGGIAHDFNNILMAMMGYTQLAKNTLPQESKAANDLAEVMRAGSRAKDLIHQILTFSRQTEQERRPMEIQLVLKEVLKLIRASIPSAIEIRSDVDGNAGCVMADPSQIHQVIMNLCTNAYQAMRERRGVMNVGLNHEYLHEDSPTIKQLNIPPGTYLRLSVSDTGHGMTQEILERIFDPYFTTKEPGKGTGMGLAVVHGIVTSLGGGITVTSEKGRGTTFKVYLPQCANVAEPETVESGSVVEGQARILYVDDEKQLAELGKRIFESLGYSVVAETDPHRALAVFRERPDEFDLVVTDLTMPELTGVEFMRELLTLREDLPVLLCTGYSDTLTAAKARKLGFKNLLRKPVSAGSLSKAVAAILGQDLKS